MIYPDYMTDEDIALFELDMERFYEDPSMTLDEVNCTLREYATEQLAEQAQLLDFYHTYPTLVDRSLD